MLAMSWSQIGPNCCSKFGYFSDSHSRSALETPPWGFHHTVGRQNHTPRWSEWCQVSSPSRNSCQYHGFFRP